MIPVVETERLVLRGWREADLDAYAEIMADEVVTHFVGGVQTRATAWRGIAAMIGHWALRSYGPWAVERKSDGKLVGRVGLQWPEGWPGLEALWTLGRQYWGSGYATEAAAASLEFGFTKINASKLISLIDPVNHRSQQVAQRIGEIKGERTSIEAFGKNYEVDVWEITREAWLAR